MSEYGSSYHRLPEPYKPRVGNVITAALCWWNERPADLRACVEGASKIAERIVAVDGAYRRYPDATIRSDPRQAAAIRAAAEEFGMECLIIEPDRLWAGQVEKRSYLLALAAVGSDWIVTLDADHIIQTEGTGARDELANSTADIVEVPFITPKGPLAATQWHLEQTQAPMMIPIIWRASLNLRVERYHWWLVATKDGRPAWAWGGDSSLRRIPYARFVTPFVIEHRTLLRTKQQVLDSRAFCNDRSMVVARTGQEDDQPGLPEPKWDYLTVPA